ncbi:hypothetical protein THRCLA_11567 [Thraustotheca clavata]|uniref:Uncharacterized protein n=1 Tax=Thraustotheca clavata TaxID=74557 RepID=A0A1V9Y7B1_9STRA|nr:hypothetical protein THRCLA_11567 [Thraustotheca clavata]
MTTKKPNRVKECPSTVHPRPPGYQWIRYEDEHTRLPFFVHATTRDVLWGHSIHNDAFPVFRKTRDKTRGGPHERRSNSVPDMRRSIVHHTYGRIDVALQLSDERMYGISPNKPKKTKSIFATPPSVSNEYEEYLMHARLHYEYMVRFYHNRGSDYSNSKYQMLHAFQFPPCGLNEKVQNLIPSPVMQKIVSNVHYQNFLHDIKIRHADMQLQKDITCHEKYLKQPNSEVELKLLHNASVVSKVKLQGRKYTQEYQRTKLSKHVKRVNPPKNDSKQLIALHLMAPTA